MILRHSRRRPPILWTSVLFILTLSLFLPQAHALAVRLPFLPRRDVPRTVYTPYTNHEPLEARAKRPEYVAHPSSELVCRPFGECEPCPRDELRQPFCMPFGNRRLLHCIPKEDEARAHGTKEGSQPAGEIPAWEACGKVVKKERQDFWEFVTANLLFLIVALSILWARTSALASAQYRQLAARIGIGVRST